MLKIFKIFKIFKILEAHYDGKRVNQVLDGFGRVLAFVVVVVWF